MAGKVEISEEDFRRNEMLRSTVAKMMSNPKAKLLMEQAHKTVDPAAPTPAIDATQPWEDRFSKIEQGVLAVAQQFEKDRTERETHSKLAAIDQKITKGFEKLRSQGVTEEGIAGVKKIMDEEGILNPDVAWAHFERLHPPQRPIEAKGYGAWNFLDMPGDGDADLKKLIETRGESNGLLDKMAYDALAEVRGGR